jgi:Tol biopolymer transport system component
VVNAGIGDQTDPHVDLNIASYRSGDTDPPFASEIRYFDFITNTYQVVPNSDFATLSDVSGGRIVSSQQTAFGSQIGVYDINTDGTFIIPGGTFRIDPSIGSQTVAFEDRSFSANPLETEIVTYNLATNTTTRLTNDSLRDTNPEVSADGNVIVFQKSATNGTGSDIWVSVQTSPGVFTTSAVTGSPGEDVDPTTNGSVVAYASDRDGDFDIYLKSVGGGVETHLDLPGVQRNPSISGGGIAFESNESGVQFDIYLYDITSNALSQVTNTPVDESLSDFTAFPFII